MPAERRRSSTATDADSVSHSREDRSDRRTTQDPGEELDEAEELALVVADHAQDGHSEPAPGIEIKAKTSRTGRAGKADKADMAIAMWLFSLVLIGVCGLALLPMAFVYTRPSR